MGRHVARAARARIGWRTWLLLGLALTFFVAVAAALSWWPLALLAVSSLVALGQWASGHSQELKAMQAVRAEGSHPALAAVVRELSQRAGIPVPEVHYSPLATPNAFAVRTSQGAAVCVTQGALDLLDQRELRAVLAHEIGHVRNNDTGVTLCTSALTTCLMWSAALIGACCALCAAFARRRSDARAMEELGSLVWSLGAAVAALLLSGVGRQREYLADQESAHLTGDPSAIGDALRRLDQGVRSRPLTLSYGTASVARLCVVSPLRPQRFGSLFASHPTTDQRVRRLEGRLSPLERQAIAHRRAVRAWEDRCGSLRQRVALVEAALRPMPDVPFKIKRGELLVHHGLARHVQQRSRQGRTHLSVEEPGTVVLTTHRLVFVSPRRRVEWAFGSWRGHRWSGSSEEAAQLVVSVSNRQKVSGLVVDGADGADWQLLLELALRQDTDAWPSAVEALRQQLRGVEACPPPGTTAAA